jgi:ribosomal protein S18 acetylase RimI-like enzyme
MLCCAYQRFLAMPDQYTIVPARKEDLATVGALAGVIWRAHYPGILSHQQIDYMLTRAYKRERLETEIVTPGHWLEVLWHRNGANERIVGYANYWLVDALGEMKLDKLYLLQECHGRGLGSRMLSHIEQQARAQGCRAIMLQVNKQNASSVRVYERNGFTVREEKVTDIGDGFVMDDYIMEKRLD